jgi:hypothetical protein
MKKSIAYAVSKGLVLLALSQTAMAEGVEYRIGWDAANERYRVYMRPDVTPAVDRTLSAQVTLRIPTGTLPQTFSDSTIGLTSAHAPGAVWSASSRAFAPSEDTSVDYISFTPTLTDQQAFALTGGEEQEIFSFHTDNICLGIVEIMDNDSDPFNNPPSGQLNSAQSNPGNEFSSLTWAADNDFLGIAGTAADCKAATGNTNPVANGDSATVAEDGTVNIDVLANDTDADNDNLTITSKTDGSNGTVTIVNDTSVTYAPAAGFSGTDTFTYTITDGEGGNSSATVSVTVTAKQSTNSNPVAVDDSAAVQSGASVEIDVLDNDTDADGDTLTLETVSDASNGTVSIEDGKAVYVANSGFTGTDSFGYTVSDGEGLGYGTVTVTVSSPADNDGDGISNEDEAALGTDPDSNDSDGDGISDSIEIGGDVSAPVDTDRDGTIDALDDDDDNDTILTIYENYNGGSPRDDDTDRDGTPDYLDADDDNDGLLTAQEAPDVNGDGNPDDAERSDNGRPLYLQLPGNAAPTAHNAIPTLTQWAQILLSMLLGLVALRTYLGKNRS